MKKTIISLLIISFAISGYAKPAKDLDKEFYEAVSDRNIKLAEKLLSEGANVNNNSGGNGWTPLMKSVLGKSSKDKKEIFDFLLSKSADVNAVNNSKGTALHIAVLSDTRTEEVEALIKAGADINARNDNMVTPLHNAVFVNSKAIVEMLIKNNADVNAQNKKGETPLIIAASDKNSLPVIELLLDAKADVSLKNAKGESAYVIAKKKVLKDIVDALIKADAK